MYFWIFALTVCACTNPSVKSAPEIRTPNAITSVDGRLTSSYKGPGKVLSVIDNKKLWEQYCVGNIDSAFPPKVNYKNPDVISAAKKLSGIADTSYYFYSGPIYAYGLKKAVGPAAATVGAPLGTSNNAHNFLVLLCGEFRDRATLIREKINWVSKIYKLPVGPQGPIDPTKSVWSQIAASSYAPYLDFSKLLFQARRADQPRTITVGEFNVDNPVVGQTVCETKFIFSEYVGKNRPFDNIENYKKELNTYSLVCSKDELDSYYDFRGDSNFKQYSPESNGMIWHATSTANQCSSMSKAKKDAKITDADCVKYFKNPFMSRWNAARAGLATWLFRSKEFDSTFSAEGEAVTIIPHYEGNVKPFNFRIGTETQSKFLESWSSEKNFSYGDMGFNSIINIKSEAPDLNLGYTRLRDAVNRHTDWYSSGYDDGTGKPKTEAYSPFMATSYVMSESDQFTMPGTTIEAPSDGRRHWMFVFRVKKSNWYTPANLADKVPINFDIHWLDETSFGTNSLADTEKAWDRLGTALEGEYDSIIYLHNITAVQEVSDDGLPATH